jgi:hypothetical protein
MLGYSPISAIDRIIEPCPQYDKYFDKPKTGELKRKMLSSDADVDQTVDLMFDVINKHYKEVDKAKHLVKGSNVNQTAQKIFDFIYNHIKYNLEPGEILHTPAAVYWHGQVMARQNPGKTSEYPIDCDDMAIMACSFLKSLHLPWALRIASYDGVKYGHVYCVVPGQNEIIIDPVYIAFNKEKPYKMQKTFVGSTEGMSGIPVYLQSVNGLSGLGQESIGLVNGLLSGSHFSGYGEIGEIDETIGLIKYLKDTKKIAEKNPRLVAKTYPKPYIFQQMLDRAINGLDTNEEAEILDILAKQEKQFISDAKAISGFAADNDWYIDEHPEDQELSGLNYRSINGIKYFNVGNLGFFGRLKLIKKIQAKRVEKAIAKGKTAKAEKLQNRAVKKVNRKINKAARAVKMLNKANPVVAPIIQKPIPIPVPVQKPVIQINPLDTQPKQQSIIVSPPEINNALVQDNKPVQVINVPIQENPVIRELQKEPDFIPPAVSEQTQPIVEEQTTVETENAENIPSVDTSEPDEETEAIVEGLANGLHFAGIGLGEIFDHNQAIKAYMKDTLEVLRKKPGVAKFQYKKPYMFQHMLETAINGLNENEESEILDILSEQEKQITNKPLSGFENDTYFIDGIGYVDFGGLGYFGRLGLFKKLKDKHRTKKIAKLEKKGKTAKVEKFKAKIVKRDTRAAKRNDKIKTIARVFNKVNPVTVAARNGLRVLISLNFLGVASKIQADPQLGDKVRDMFKKMGGDVGKINKSIMNGAKKSPLNKTTGNVKTIDGLDGFGAVVALSALVNAAGKLVNKIIEWSKKKTIKTADGSTLPNTNYSQNTTSIQTEPSKPGLFKKLINKAKEKLEQKTEPVQEEITEPVKNDIPANTGTNKTNIALWAAGIVAIAGVAYFATSRKKDNNAIRGFKKLSGIRLK